MPVAEDDFPKPTTYSPEQLAVVGAATFITTLTADGDGKPFWRVRFIPKQLTWNGRGVLVLPGTSLDGLPSSGLRTFIAASDCGW